MHQDHHFSRTLAARLNKRCKNLAKTLFGQIFWLNWNTLFSLCELPQTLSLSFSICLESNVKFVDCCHRKTVNCFMRNRLDKFHARHLLEIASVHTRSHQNWNLQLMPRHSTGIKRETAPGRFCSGFRRKPVSWGKEQQGQRYGTGKSVLLQFKHRASVAVCSALMADGWEAIWAKPGSHWDNYIFQKLSS